MTNEDTQLQALINSIAFDRLLGTFENFPLERQTTEQFRKNTIPIVKMFLHLMVDFNNAQIEEGFRDRVFNVANEVVLDIAHQANKHPTSY